MNKQKQEVTNRLIHLKNSMSKEFDKIKLPGETMLIKRDKPLEKTSSGIFLGENDTEITNIGTIVKLGSSIVKGGYNFIGLKVRFKEAFGEALIIDNEEYLFFREVEPSIYYYINEED